MKSQGRNRSTSNARAAHELRIGFESGKVIFQAPRSGFNFVLDQGEVKGLLFCEASKKLEVSLHRGSTISIKCDFENAKFYAVRLLPEERDNEFMYQPIVGERCRAWDDLR
ncbi:hypothetical protein [Ralstonia sp.]|uniref:hypothetical protein n=1 Tax=Ralstonia sp. TaxID=54061 RepID=UPI0031CE99EC